MIKNKNKVLVYINSLLFLFVCLFVIIFLSLFTQEEKNDKKEIEFYSLSLENKQIENKEDKENKTLNNKMYNDEYSEMNNNYQSEDPDLVYAVKLLESEVNKRVLKHFRKPFNYTFGNNCSIDIDLNNNNYTVTKCNSDSLLKREVEISLQKIKPITKKTYNNINLAGKKINIVINLDL